MRMPRKRVGRMYNISDGLADDTEPLHQKSKSKSLTLRCMTHYLI